MQPFFMLFVTVCKLVQGVFLFVISLSLHVQWLFSLPSLTKCHIELEVEEEEIHTNGKASTEELGY